MSCPCGLLQEIVLDLDRRDRVPLLAGKCQNPKADGTDGVCGRPLGAHPHQQPVPVITQALAPPLPPAYQPQPVQPLPVIISYQMMMMNVDGSLTSLSSCRGFRNYVKARADEVGITGVIQRYHHNDVRIQFEGNEDQVSVFIQFLTACRGQRMIELFEGVSRSSNIVRLYDSFDIITDFSRTVECGGKVHRGRFSDPDHDKSSVYSSDQPYIFNYNASI